MKKQFRQLKKEYEERSTETENLKKILKSTKINELNIEIKTLNEEMAKLKTLYLHSLQQNEIHENNLKEMKTLQENFSKQHFIILNFQENLQKMNEDTKSKNSEIDALRENLNKNLKLVDKLKKDLTNANNMREKLFKENHEKNEVAIIQRKYEKQITELNKEINRYREIADRKDRTIRETESLMKKSGNQTGQKPNSFNYSDIKYVQENPEEKYDNLSLLLKSKLMEALKEKDNLEKRVNRLEEKLKNNDMNSDPLIGRSQTSFSQSNRLNHENLTFSNDDYLTDYTYYLIKNFEARKITHNIAMKKIFNNLVTNDKNEIETDNVLKILINNVIDALNVKLDSDKKNLEKYAKKLLNSSEGKLDIFLEKFNSIFYNVKSYKTSEKNFLKQQLYKQLKKYEEEFKQKSKNFDTDSKGIISFENLKKLFESMNLQINPDLIEFMIYWMKSEENDKMSLCDLNYEVVLKFLSNTPSNLEKNIANAITENEENEKDDDDDDEIVITSDNFNEKVENVLRQIHNHIKSTNQSFREIFKKHIVNLNEIQEFKHRNEDVIHLKDFLDTLNSIDINLVDIDVYCIYTKLKLIDDYDFMSIRMLEEELQKFNENPINPTQNVDILDVDMSKIIKINLNLDQIKENESPIKQKNFDPKNVNELNLAYVMEDDDDYDLDLEKEVVLDEGFLDENLDDNRMEMDNKEKMNE